MSDKVYFSKVQRYNDFKDDKNYLTFILIPRKWWSVEAWKFAIGIRAKMLAELTKLLACLILAFLACCGVVYAGDDANLVPIQTIMQEEANNYQSMVAIGQVIRNRAFKGRRSFERVCLTPYQFSCWNERGRAAKWLKRYGTEELYQKAARAWAESETAYNPGYTHYHTIDIMPYWAVGHKGTTIAEHVFYKGIN